MTDTFLLGGHALLGDGTLAPVDLHLRDGLVSEMGTELKPAPGARVLELDGCIVTPGLIDAHTHISFGGRAPLPTSTNGLTARTRANLREILRSGVTAVRDVGALDGVVRDAAANGPFDRPAVFSANQIVCAVGGHGTEVLRHQGLPKIACEAKGRAQFRAAVRSQFERGAHLVKITLNSAGTAVEMSVAEVEAAVGEAHRLGLRVACHASTPEAIETGVAAGVDTIEHGNGASLDQLRRMADTGIVLVPTAWIFQQNLADARGGAVEVPVHDPPVPVEVWQARVDAHRTVVRDAIACGVTLAAGTDAVTGYPVDTIADELLALHRLGLPPLAALRAATLGGATALGEPHRGVLGEGVPADLAVFTGEPTRVVVERRRPFAVFRSGRRIV